MGENNISSINTTDRYSRQIKAGIKQEFLQRGKVIVVGAGALGNVISITLAQAGVGHITLIDMDTIEFSNLNRQIMFREADVGKMKAIIAQEHLLELNSEVIVEAITKPVQNVPLSIYQQIHPDGVVVLADALDNFEARRWLNAVAVEKKLPLVSGGMFGHLGNVQLILPDQTACLECQPLIPERELQKACTPPGEVRKAQQDTKSKISLEDYTKEFDYFPALGSVSAVVGGIMSHEIQKLLQKQNLGQLMLDYLFMDLSVMSFLRVPLSRRVDCVVCSSKYKLEGIPFYVDLNEELGSIRKRIGFQFNIDATKIELTYRAQSLTDNSYIIREILGNTPSKIYVMSPEIPLPIKLTLLISKS